MIALSAAWATVSGLFSLSRWARRLMQFRDGFDSVPAAAMAWSRDRTSRALGVAIAPRTWIWVVAVVAALTVLVAYTWFVADWQSKADRLAARERAAIRNIELEAVNSSAIDELNAARTQRAEAEAALRAALSNLPEVVERRVEVPVTVERRVEVPVRVPSATPAHTPPDLREKLNNIK